MELVAQEEGMGCGIACVASVLGISYQEARKISENPDWSYSKGYGCKDLANILNKKGKNYIYKKFKSDHNSLLKKSGTIVFVKEGYDDLWGHYLLKTDNGWMDCWINWPSINPAKAGYHKELIGEPKWIIYEEKSIS